MAFTWDRRHHRSESRGNSRTGGWRGGRATGGLLGLSLATAMLTAGTGHSADAAAPARLTSKSRVSTQGLGPVRIGMTKAAAERAARMPMRYSGAARFGCRYMRPADARIRASFMLHRGRVVRVDVGRRGIATPSGVRVGDTESSVRRRFAGQLRIQRHVYSDGYYLEFVPKDSAERNRRVIFETVRGRVTYIRAGRLPEVRYIEGCS